jgi:hypothetical protein
MAKLVLNMKEMQEDFFADTAMIGIATAMPGYHLCWALNRHFDIDFERDPEQNISSQKKENQYHFPIYQYLFPNSSHKYMLYKLKNGAESLLPETKQLDYLWMVQTTDPEHDAMEIALELRNMPDVQLAQIIDAEQLKKSIKNLLV